jgi:hypothetical protein
VGAVHAAGHSNHTDPTEPTSWPASREASVAVEIGPGRGALVLRTDQGWADREVELSAAEDPEWRTHVAVRERQLPGGSIYAALFGSLATGTYHVVGTAQLVTVEEGVVSEVELVG